MIALVVLPNTLHPISYVLCRAPAAPRLYILTQSQSPPIHLKITNPI